jgi:hypothetical protein
MVLSRFRKSSDGHRLIVEFAAGRLGERRNFTVGIKASDGRYWSKHRANGFDFLFNSLLKNQLSTYATDEKRQIGLIGPFSMLKCSFANPITDHLTQFCRPTPILALSEYSS